LLLVGAAAVLAAMLHPIGDPLRAFSAARVDLVALAMVGVVAVPLLISAWTNIALQRAGPSEHAVMGHYGHMAAFSFTVIGVGVLASLRPTGWRLVAWVAGALPVALGIVSIVYPDVESSLAAPWSVAAIAWGVVFIAWTAFDRRG
jgi:hypothetical protein